jgi:hypothetical protein
METLVEAVTNHTYMTPNTAFNAICHPTASTVPERMGVLHSGIDRSDSRVLEGDQHVSPESGLDQRIVRARTLILDQAHIDLHDPIPFLPPSSSVIFQHINVQMHTDAVMIMRSSATCHCNTPTAIALSQTKTVTTDHKPSHHQNHHHHFAHARGRTGGRARAGACAIDRSMDITYLQRGHQGAPPRVADGRVLVADVQLGEGGVHLHAAPTRYGTRSNGGPSNAQKVNNKISDHEHKKRNYDNNVEIMITTSPSVRLFLPPPHPSVHQYIPLSLQLCFHHSAHPSISPSLRPSIHPPTHPPTHQFIHPSIHPSYACGEGRGERADVRAKLPPTPPHPHRPQSCPPDPTFSTSCWCCQTDIHQPTSDQAVCVE